MKDSPLKFIDDFKAGKLSKTAFLKKLEKYSYHKYFDVLDHATLDPHREKHTGIEEVIFAQGKNYQDLKQILFSQIPKKNSLLVTKLSSNFYEKLLEDHLSEHGSPLNLLYEEVAQLGCFRKNQKKVVNLKSWGKQNKNFPVLILTAGTSDRPIAEECRLVLKHWGIESSTLWDVGVSNLVRVLARRKELQNAKVVVVVAGMEAALATVVNGMVRVPVIAVPTSVGYGASFNGLAALLGMMTACSPGIAVVNIDNGLGAAALVKKILEGQPTTSSRKDVIK